MKSLTCEMARPLLSNLLAGSLAADDADGVEAHLSWCESCRAEFEALATCDRGLAELAALADLDRLAARIRAALQPKDEAKSSRRRVRLAALVWPASLAAGILIAAALFFWPEARTPAAVAIARVEQVEGEVYLLLQESRTPARQGQELFAGQGLEVGDEGLAIVTYPDATRLELAPETVVRWSAAPDQPASHARKKLFVEQGAVTADVAEQPPSDPMVLTTPHAEIQGAGNRFSLVNTADSTQVELERGMARVTRRSDGQTVRVERGAYVTTAGEALTAQPLPPRISQPRAVLEGQGAAIWCLAFAEVGTDLASGGADGSVVRWDSLAGQLLWRHEGHTRAIRCLAFAPDGRLLATASDDRSLRFWDAEGPTLLPARNHPSAAFGVRFSAEGRTLLTAAYDRAIRRYDVATGQLRSTLRTAKQPPAGEFPACMTFSSDGRMLALGIKDHTARLVNALTAKELHRLRGHEDAVVSTAFSPDGLTLATGSRDRTIRLWDVATGQPMAVLRGHRHSVNGLSFSPDGRTLASGSADTTVKLWDVATARERATLRGHTKPVAAVAFAPDSRTLASGGSDGVIDLWNVPMP